MFLRTKNRREVRSLYTARGMQARHTHIFGNVQVGKSDCLLSALDDLDEAPTLHLGHRTGLHNADGVAHASRALLVVSVQLLGAGHHLAVLGVTLALGDGDNNGLGTGESRSRPVRTLRELRESVMFSP